MTPRNLSITFDIEPVVKLRCKASQCAHNMARMGTGAFCELKDLIMDTTGKCTRYEARHDEAQA